MVLVLITYELFSVGGFNCQEVSLVTVKNIALNAIRNFLIHQY